MEELRAPMVGRVIEVLVQPGAAVDEDTEVLVIESMKMQIPINAPRKATVREIRVNAGDTVQEGEVLLMYE